jgi:hypothetical protein
MKAIVFIKISEVLTGALYVTFKIIPQIISQNKNKKQAMDVFLSASNVLLLPLVGAQNFVPLQGGVSPKTKKLLMVF